MKTTAKKLLAAVLGVSLIAACFASCAGNGGTSGDDTLKIGGTGPLTGGAASYGNSVKNAAELAIKEINDNGGVNGMKLELLFEDDEAKGDKAKSAFEKLMDNGMQIMMGAVTSDASIALNDLVKTEGILQITPSGSAQQCTENPNAFRICFTDPMQGEIMAEYIFNQGLTKMGVIYNQNDSYSGGINDAFKAKYTALGGEIVAETSFAGDDAKDFNSQLTRIKGTDAQGIFMPIYNDKAAQIAIAANEKGVTLPLFGCDGWDGILEKYLSKPEQAALIEGATYLTPFTASDENEAIQKFVNAYKAAYGATPDQFAADAYDAIYTIKAVLEKTGIKNTKLTAEDNQALVKAMTEIEVDGLTGKMTFTAEGEPNKGAKVAKIEGGKYHVIVQ